MFELRGVASLNPLGPKSENLARRNPLVLVLFFGVGNCGYPRLNNRSNKMGIHEFLVKALNFV